MDRFVRVTVRRRLHHSVDAAYAWLTDYSDDDPERTDAVVRTREVVERSHDRVRLRSNIRVVGVDRGGESIITFHPPDTWRATQVAGRGKGTIHTYHLTPRPDGGSTLTVHYDLRVRRLRGLLQVWLAKPLIKRELERMWDGFERAMAEELAAEAPAP